MSGRDHLGERDAADEVYPPGERYQADPPVNYRALIITAAIAGAVFVLAKISGLDAVGPKVPAWLAGAIPIAAGLFLILAPGREAASRSGNIVSGAFSILFGAAFLALGLTGAGR